MRLLLFSCCYFGLYYYITLLYYYCFAIFIFCCVLSFYYFYAFIIFYLFVIYWNVFEKGFLWHALTLDFSYYISCFFEFPVLFALLINFIIYFTT